MSLKNRVEMYFSAKNIQRKEFISKTGYGSTKLTKILQEKTLSPQSDFFIAFAEHYPDLNIGWLLTGNGKMFNSDLNSKNLLVSASEQIDYAAGNISKTELDPVSIPGIEGEGRTFEISDRWLYPILKYGEHLASVRFRVKDYELVDPQKIYAVVTPKKVHITFCRSTPSGLLLLPANKTLDKAITLERQDILEMWVGLIKLSTDVIENSVEWRIEELERRVAAVERREVI